MNGDNMARLAQSAERKALNLVLVGSSPTVGVCFVHMQSSFLRHTADDSATSPHEPHLDLRL